MTNLLKRIITAIIGVAIIISAIVYGQWSFIVLFGLITLLSLLEFLKLGKQSGRSPFKAWALVNGILIFVGGFLQAQNQMPLLYWLIIFASLSSILILAILRKKRENLIYCIAFSMMGILYIIIPMSLLSFIAFAKGEYAYGLIIGLLFCQWANDTGGYFAGKAFGKLKLYEAISPNKTWEGSIGGLALVLLVATVFSYIFNEMTLIEWLGLGTIVAVFGSIGDLAESLFKRNLAIKDSGSSIPGHGGFLDRFDGLFLALPFATLYIHLVI